MAKPKASSSRPAGQVSIASFFSGKKSKTERVSTPVSDDEDPRSDFQTEPESEATIPETAPASETSDVEMDEPEVEKVQAKKILKAAAPDASDLPPIHDIPAIFDDLVGKIPEIKDVAEHIKGRKLRVATMCSGTESPLLALGLIQKSLEDQHGIRLDVEHVFSCEIEPFKQAYIERNFQPPVLFRDVCELGDEEAHTAYGALVPIPGDVDLLVAGTSCVDYSNLNTQKQDIDANGESGRTFRGMMSWVKNHRPPLVILENVCSAPWDKVQGYFEDEGYSATWSRVDTKNYYIPHTRTRVYLIAVNQKKCGIPAKWKDCVISKLKRPASSTLDAFLLPSDDPRIHLARQKLVQESNGGSARKTGRTDWGRCESRHQRARLEEELGNKRPLTSWDDGGYCKLPDFAWNDWGVGQVERVWDLMDISLLRAAAKGVDPSYKTVVWNLSQNVDRTIGSNKVGICPCLTPSMIPYITNRGGPMVGLEALSMQGLPVDKLLLTRESEDQLADLAGNAMSSTVVGACILAALVSGKKLLKTGDDRETYEMKANLEEGSREDSMDVDEAAATSTVSLTEVIGEDELSKKPLDLSPTGAHTLAQLLTLANRSRRLCTCEGRVDMTTRKLSRCKDCSSTFCIKCGGRPEHNTEPCTEERVDPIDFAQAIKSALPMSVSLSGISEDSLQEIQTKTAQGTKSKLWTTWKEAVSRIKDHDLHFVELKRQEVWGVIYQSSTATLELFFHPLRPEWRLFAVPEAHEPANAEIRQVLQHPVARLVCNRGLLSGTWEFAVPVPMNLSIKIEGVGEPVPSWQASLGLVGEAFKTKKVYSKLKVTVAKNDVHRLDRDVSGEYVLLDRCGTANNALHKKIPGPEDEGLPSLFLIFDAHRTNEEEDCFVFSDTIRRLECQETRPLVCKLDPKWRQSDKTGDQTVDIHLPWKWVEATSVLLKAAKVRGATYAIPEGCLDLSMTSDACRSAYALLACSVPLGTQAGPEWPRGEWAEVDKIHERGIFRSMAWLLERIRHVGDNFRDWQIVQLPDDFDCKCERCAPTAPSLNWVHVGSSLIAREDPVEAGDYERRLKRRPAPFTTQLRLDDTGLASIRIGTNIPSLLHRALSRLPTKNRDGKPILSWKLDTNYSPTAETVLRRFSIMSNKDDAKHTQPPNFKIELRPEQLQSLGWMLRQEDENAPPFIEEEIAEAILDPLGWRAEGKAERPVRVLGGILADQVGYGKTAITLGLIDCTRKSIKKAFAQRKHQKGKIASAATLVVVPSHLTRQWQSETKKFIKEKNLKVVMVSTVMQLNKITIQEIQEADVIIWSQGVQRSAVYLENLSQFAGIADFPSGDGGRHYNSHLEKTSEALKAQVDLLQDEGAGAVLAAIQEAKERVAAEEAAAAAAVVSKRLKGKSYREAVEKVQQAAKTMEAKPTISMAKADPKPKPKVEKKLSNGTKSNTLSQGTARPTPSGLIPEVVITSRPNHSSTASSPGPVDSDEEENNDRPRRVTAKRVLVESDDDEIEEVQPKRQKTHGGAKKVNQPKNKGKEKAKKAKDEKSDYEASSADESDDDSDEGSIEESDNEFSDSSSDDKPRAKKPAKKATGKGEKGKSVANAASSSDAETEDVDMDVDEPKTKPAKGKGKAPAKKKPQRSDTDPWKLKSMEVKRDWTQMKCPPLEMFQFARVVIDEYTYLSDKAGILAMVTNLTADRTWVLSGTPPTSNFTAVKTIAAFFNIHLGIDAESFGKTAEDKKIHKSLTSAEKFHSFREMHSLEWHAHRHTIAQRFINQFMRQNIAEIGEIVWEVEEEKIILPAAERALYLELEHHLRTTDMTIKRGRKNESDREKRLNRVLGESNTAEEALLKRCSHFDLYVPDDGKKGKGKKDNEPAGKTKGKKEKSQPFMENAMKACDIIVQERTAQLNECKESLLKELKKAVAKEKELSHVEQESIFSEYVRICRSEGIDDDEATQTVVELLDEAKAGSPKAPKGKASDGPLSEKVKAKIWEHREATHEIRRITKELTGRIRSLRYFTVVRDIQREKDKRKPVKCPACGKTVPLTNVAVLSTCGHEGCLDCVEEYAKKEECVYSMSGKCKAAARATNVIRADILGEDDVDRDGRGRHFGRKLETVVDLMKNKIPQEERILLFVQFEDLMIKVKEALTYNKIDFLEIGGGQNGSKNLEAFQKGSDERVLLLNVMNESASGANLTIANHAIFLSPLLAPTNEIYTACETQAIGRLVRYGQSKPVKIYKFMSTDTMDQEIYERREAAQARAAAEESNLV